MNPKCDHSWCTLHGGKIRCCSNCSVVEYDSTYVRKNLESVLATAEKFGIDNLIRDCKNWIKLDKQKGYKPKQESMRITYTLSENFHKKPFIQSIALEVDSAIMQEVISSYVKNLFTCENCSKHENTIQTYGSLIVVKCSDCGKIEVIE
jgi:hypothetical protein